MIEEARRSPKDTDVSHEELGRRLGLTEDEQVAAQAIVDRWLQEDATAAPTAPAANGVPPDNRTNRKTRARTKNVRQ
jgi:hypothetical protein